MMAGDDAPARIARIRERLEVLGPAVLDIEDESHLHAGHAGAQSGKGHFRVTIVAEIFTSMTPLKRHRLVYEALGDLLETDIHAVAIKAATPAEAEA